MTTRDLVSMDATDDERYYLLRSWAEDFDMGVTFLNYHRLQVERYVYDMLAKYRPLSVADISHDEAPRRWLVGNVCQNYSLLGLTEACDEYLDLLAAPAQTLCDVYDAVVCTEVLEHVKEPFKATKTIHKLLRPGGLLIGSTPFCWPDHRTSDYDDYWRFTEQGLGLLLAQFDDVSIHPIQWTSEGKYLHDLIRRFEGQGLRSETYMCTGFVFDARRGKE